MGETTGQTFGMIAGGIVGGVIGGFPGAMIGMALGGQLGLWIDPPSAPAPPVEPVSAALVTVIPDGNVSVTSASCTSAVGTTPNAGYGRDHAASPTASGMAPPRPRGHGLPPRSPHRTRPPAAPVRGRHRRRDRALWSKLEHSSNKCLFRQHLYSCNQGPRPWPTGANQLH